MYLATFPTDTGSGRKRKYLVRGVEYTSLSLTQKGRFLPGEKTLEELVTMAQEEGFQTITMTSKGTYYLKCHKDDVEYDEIIPVLVRNWNLGKCNKSTTYLLPRY